MRVGMWGSWMWLGCFQFFVMEQVVRLGWRGAEPYHFARNYVSDLGAVGCGAAVCSPWHSWMDGSFVVQGVLIAAGAVLAWRTGLAKAGLALLIMSGLGLVGVGLVPEDVVRPWHAGLAALHFLAAGLGMAWIGLRGRDWLAAVTGVVVLWATFLVGDSSLWGARMAGPGTLERVAAYGIAAWMVWMGARQMQQRQLPILPRA